MNQPITLNGSRGARKSPQGVTESVAVQPQRANHAVDSNALRWVLAGTVAFWLVVFEAGRSLFF